MLLFIDKDVGIRFDIFICIVIMIDFIESLMRGMF